MRSVILFYVVLVLSLFTACSQEGTSPDEEEGGFAVMAYYVPGDIDPGSLPLSKLTHIIISFTEVINKKMAFPNTDQYAKLRSIVNEKKKYPGLKVMVACGGWGGSGGFSDMAASAADRKVFVKSVIHFLEKYNVDGLDIDWEYPGMPGIGNPYRAEDKENFTSLMKELRMAMNKTGKQYVLTFAAAGWEGYFDHIELDKVMKYADYINMMTYDFEGGHTPVAAHHTNLGKVGLFNIKSEAGKNYFKESPKSAEKIINFVRSKGVNPRQIVIGCAFYARGWKGVPPENNGLYQSNKGYWKTLSYDNLHDYYESRHNFVRFWDETAKAPFLYNAIDSIFISYDDAISVKLKTRYALDNDLGGVMFWELKHDLRNNILLNAIYTQVK
jgi:chitinase